MFYDRFIELCKLKGVQPAKVARDLGLNQSTVSMWKSRGTTPTAATLNDLVKYFDTSMDYLLQIEVDEKSPELLDNFPKAKAVSPSTPEDTTMLNNDLQKLIDMYECGERLYLNGELLSDFEAKLFIDALKAPAEYLEKFRKKPKRIE